MNEIHWPDDVTVGDLYDHWIELVENGDRAGLLKELSHSANSRQSAHVVEDDGSLSYHGPEYDTDDMFIIELAYGSDADKIIGLIREHEEYEVGENLE